MAEPIPSGHAINNAKNVITIVLTRAGMTEQLSEVYFQAKSDGRRYGTPLIRMYPSIKARSPSVMMLQNRTKNLMILAFSF